MPSTPSSPTSTRRKRRSLRLSSTQFSIEPPSPGIENVSFHSRRSSQSSIQQFSPVTPRPNSSRSKRPSSSRLSIGSNISTGLASNAGLGNLADELEEAWDGDSEGQVISMLEDFDQDYPDQIVESPLRTNGLPDIDTTMTPQSPPRTNLLQPPSKPQSPSKQWASIGTPQRKTESLYDGSDYGPSSDDEAFDSIPPTLQRRIHDVEEITKIASNADALSESGGVIARTTDALRTGLGPQAEVETATTRLITAYTSMATHRSHQLREVANAVHRLTSSSVYTSTLYDLPPETIELLLTEIESLTSTLSFLPAAHISSLQATPLATLQAFASNTHDLFVTLHNLSDTLTEHRQHLLSATRRLKSVRDIVNDFATEEELVETSMMLIQAGDWDRRCRERQAGKVMGEVLEGFRKTWNVDYVEGAWKPTSLKRRSILVR